MAIGALLGACSQQPAPQVGRGSGGDPATAPAGPELDSGQEADAPDVEPESEELPEGELAPPEYVAQADGPDADEPMTPKEADATKAAPELGPDVPLPTEGVEPSEADLAQAEAYADGHRSVDEQRGQAAIENRDSYAKRELPADAPPVPELPKP